MDRIEKLLEDLTLEEKVKLISGYDFWTTEAIDRLKIPSIMMTDGPHGLRKQVGDNEQLGQEGSVPATCFPSGVALASSWDKDLIEMVGQILGLESQKEDVAVLLGPAVNIKRSPLCGRNFEYFSEDPFLSSMMAKHHILGVQSQGVGTSIKHFAVNNQEYKRMTLDACLDERALREIYLASFETAIKEAKPWTVMCAYNKLNGKYCSDHYELLTDILRNEWQYDGLVLSDWGAVNNRLEGVKAGMDLEMPSSKGRYDQGLIEAVKSGKLKEEDLDNVVARVLTLVDKAVKGKQTVNFSFDDHDHLARKVASECLVLLKNDNQILPLRQNEKILLVGDLARITRYQGGGSSHIRPTKIHHALDVLKDQVVYKRGYDLAVDQVNTGLVKEALIAAKSADKIVVFAGLPERYESEGYDRQHMRMPANQVGLINDLYEVNPNIVVVLANGSPVEMPWLDKVDGLIEGYLAGQASGLAVADVLYGHVNPSGKLAETLPIRLEDNPSELFPTEGNKVTYGEGIFVGYRYYDKKKMKVNYPFGHGLSYTKFEYSNLQCLDAIKDTDHLLVSLNVENTGTRHGKEVVQLYISDLESTYVRPIRELKGFEKISLKAGEKKTVTFELDKRSFAYYNVAMKDWHVETGDFLISLASSSRDIRLEKKVHVRSSQTLKIDYDINSTLEDVLKHPAGRAFAEEVIQNIKVSFEQGGLFEEEGARGMAESFTLRTMLMFDGSKEDFLMKLIEELNK